MAKSEGGEFELVMGNRQLLSVFGIVVILVAVFFTMGYVVGRNSAAGFAKTDKPIVVDSARQSAAISPAERPPEPKPPPTTDTTLTDPPVKPGQYQKPPQSNGTSPMPEEPVAGQTYLQVVAVQRAEAEVFLDVLGKKGFHAIYAPVPDKADTFRVLVGPYKDPASTGQARTDLEAAGFKNAIVRKY